MIYTVEEYAAMAAKANEENKILEIENGEFVFKEQPYFDNKPMLIKELEAEAQQIIPYIQAGIDAEYNQQRLIDVILEIEELKGNLE